MTDSDDLRSAPTKGHADDVKSASSSQDAAKQELGDVANRNTVGHAPRRRHWMALLFPACWPLILGAGVFALYMWLAGREAGLTTRDIGLIMPSPFKGIDLVYGMIFASLATVGFATYLYLSELETMMYRAPPDAGRTKIRYARFILKMTLGIDILLFFLLLLFNGSINSMNGCNYETLLYQAKLHDMAVGVIFLVFIVADLLTYAGLRDAIPLLALDSDGARHARWEREFALQQLWLIDVPVLVGAALSVLAVVFAASASGWDRDLLHLNPLIDSYMERKRLTTVFTCNGQLMSLPEFQQTIARIFTAGIAMGYLAAHVLMSQFVFIALTILHRHKMESDHSA